MERVYFQFPDRAEAGRQLAGRLLGLQLDRPVVYALPRGGVPVAFEVAKALQAPLDVFVVRKLGMPGHEELAMGAAVDGLHPGAVWNDYVVRQFRVSEADRAKALDEKLAEIAARRKRYLGDRAPVPLKGRDAVVIDDGIATGATTRAALLALCRRGPASITLAVPVAISDTFIIAEGVPFVLEAPGVMLNDIGRRATLLTSPAQGWAW